LNRALRKYQQDIYAAARTSLAENRSVCVQLATGAGKTPVMAAMCESVLGKGKRAWVVVPRKELLRQASRHLLKWLVPHGIINADSQESRAYKIHVVSKDTLTRRWNKIKNWPDIIFIDECHLNLDFQLKLLEHIPAHTKIIGYTATSERYDGRGLSLQSGGIYEILIEGPSIPELTAGGYLAPLRYFSPPLDGLDKIRVNKFGEYDEESLEELLQRRKVYGDLVSHYAKHGRRDDGSMRAALIFCRSIKSAHHAAERFCERGYSAAAIDGTMSDREVENTLDRHRKGEILVLCNCLLVTYGVDIERIEYIGDISPTQSLAMYMQKIGRGLRPYPGKTDLIYMDHVNQVLTHQNPDYPGVPLHYVPKIDWNFHGTEKRKREKNKNIVLCPHLDFMYCENPHCASCEHNPDHAVRDCRRPMVVIPAELAEITQPIALAERPLEERRIIEDRIGALVLEYKREMSPGPVGELLKIAEQCGYAVLWVYYRLTDDARKTVNIPLLAEIARQKKYHPWWVKHQINKVRARYGDEEAVG
jgi:superfamily II DNA or RNA helicase